MVSRLFTLVLGCINSSIWFGFLNANFLTRVTLEQKNKVEASMSQKNQLSSCTRKGWRKWTKIEVEKSQNKKRWSKSCPMGYFVIMALTESRETLQNLTFQKPLVSFNLNNFYLGGAKPAFCFGVFKCWFWHVSFHDKKPRWKLWYPKQFNHQVAWEK